MVGKVANAVVYLENNLYILFNKFLGYVSPSPKNQTGKMTSKNS